MRIYILLPLGIPLRMKNYSTDIQHSLWIVSVLKMIITTRWVCPHSWRTSVRSWRGFCVRRSAGTFIQKSWQKTASTAI